MTNAIYASLIVAALYGLAHSFASGLDREHCQAHNMAYGGTGLLLDGYCVQGTVRIPAFAVGEE